jgi:transcriptional regulator
MHPNAAFRSDDRALIEAIVDEIGFGTVFAATPDGPRVAHTPLVQTGDGALQFHLSRGNALVRHLDGSTALALVNGPEAYVSPRWYGDGEQVPTWNYVAIEMEGRVRKMDRDGMMGLLETLVERQEARLAAGEPWTMAKMPRSKLDALANGIVGFEMEVQAWRPTFKLSQNKPADERERVAAGLEAAGSPAIAQLMRTLAR